MVVDLDAVYEELLRLKSEGMNRVFINDTTLELLKKAQIDNRKKPGTTPAPVEVIDDLKVLAATQPTASSNTITARKTAERKLPSPPSIALPEEDPQTQMDWLQQQVETCSTCLEQRGAEGHIVFGTGSIDADLFFCGEAPNEADAANGQPFVGAAGELLNKIIQAMGVRNESVYKTHLLKWRPAHDKPYGNRPPNEAEMNFCRPYLQAQIAIVKPKVIVALGKFAIAGLLGREPVSVAMNEVRGQWEEVAGIPTMLTYNPSYLLHNNTLQTKRKLWEDMLEVMQKLEIEVSPQQKGYFLPK